MSAEIRRHERLFAELKRRSVFRVMAVYGLVGFGLLQVVDLAVPALLLPDWTFRFFALALLVGFPVALVIAWAFETTPAGVRRTAPASERELHEIVAAPASRRWPAGVLALVGAAALLGGVWYAGRQSAGGPADAADGDPISIAVLPFVNMSSDPDQEYFSDGIAEELLNLLAQVPELRVAARTSSFSFKDGDLEIPEIAQRLQVGHVLEGSVRKADDRVRITAQLIRDDGFHEWSKTWDRTLDDIFAIQDEIAADVASQLRVSLLGHPPATEETAPEAYTLALQARHLHLQGTVPGLERASELYQQAISVAPDYAAAWSGLAANEYQLTIHGVRGTEGFERAGEMAERALGLDSTNVQAHTALGMIAQAANDRVVASRHYAEALRLNPDDPESILYGATMLSYLGRDEEAVRLLDGLIARDPVNPRLFYRRGIVLYHAGDYEGALRSVATVLELAPNFTAAHYFRSISFLMLDRPEQALAAARREIGDEEYRVKGEALALYDLGRAEEFKGKLLELQERWGDRWPSEVAQVYAWIGDADAAFAWLDRAVEQNEDGMTQQYRQPFYRPIHDDPRWREFRERTGTTAAELAAIEFDVPDAD